MPSAFDVQIASHPATDETQNDLLKQALAYARAGKAVFPCMANGKFPATSNGFYAATTDENQIRAWWAENPRYNVAIVPEDCGWLVVDLDPAKHAGDQSGADTWAKLIAEHGRADTYTVETPSGGKHLYYSGSGRSTVKKALGAGVDTRGVRGYVLIPPSVVGGKPYTVAENVPIAELPAWVSSALETSVSEAREAVAENLDTPAAIDRVKRLLAAAEPATEGQGGDGRTFELACRVRELGVSEPTANELMAAWNQRSEPPWPDDELATKIANAYRYAQNGEGAWAVPSATETFETAARAAGLLNDAPDQPPASDAPPPPPGVDPDDWARAWKKLGYHTHIEGRDRRPSDYWPETRLPRATDEGIVGLILAPSGGGKTTMIGYQAMAVIKAGGRVVYFPGEGRLGLDTGRIPAWQAAYGVSDETMLANWRTSDQIPTLASDADMAVVLHHHAGFLRVTGGVVIFDTLKSATPGVEENSSAMGDFLASDGAIRRFADAAKVTALVAHHLGKDKTKDSRGHSSIEGNSDFVEDVKWQKAARRLELVHRKDRDGADGLSYYYESGPGRSGVPVVKPIGEDAYRALKPSAVSGRVEEVREALETLFAGQTSLEPVSSDVLANEIVMRREQICTEAAEQAGEPHEPPSPEVLGQRITNERKRLNEYSRPEDGQQAELYAFAVKGADGKIIVGKKGERQWLPTWANTIGSLGAAALEIAAE